MFFKEQVFLLFLTINTQLININCEEVTITLNLKRALHVVSDQFISFKIDPKYFFQNVNLSSQSFNIITSLSPAFIRLSGPSTKVLTWTDPAKLGTDNDHLLTGLYGLTPSKWIDFNEWALNTNLTPIFALNDRHRINGVWDPRDSLAMMTITDQMNYSCFWELGYDCTNTTLSQYISDLTSLQHILDAFPASKDYWGTIGSDFSGCITKPSFEVIRNFLLSVESSLDAINWHIKDEENTLSEKDPIVKALMPTAKTKLPVMLTIPHADNSASFRNGLEWALELGNAAKYGFGVIFRQPTRVELLKETPVFWVGLLHKNLLGRNTLDVKITGTNRTRSQVYSHCTKRQNNYSRRGAVTLFAVNTQTTNMTIALRPFGNQLRSIEIQSYILTSNGNIDDSEIFLNNEKLTYDLVSKSGKLDLIPKIRRARANRVIMLELPPQSIGFFVLPGAQSHACIFGEEESELIVEEIIEDQNTAIDVETTTDNDDVDNSLSDISEETSGNIDDNPLQAQWEKILHTKSKDPKTTDNYNFTRQHFIDRAKLLEKHKQFQEAEQRRLDLKHKLAEKMRNLKEEAAKQTEMNNLEDFELTSEEVQLILAQRAKKSAKSRQKRFLPIELMQSFAERVKKSNQNEKPVLVASNILKSRPKRQIAFDESRFTRRRGSRLESRLERLRNKKEAIVNDQYNPNTNIGMEQLPPPQTSNNLRIKPIKIVPQADVFMDLVKESIEKNTDYDYLESEENLLHQQFVPRNSKPKIEKKTHTRRGGKTVIDDTTGLKDPRFLEDMNIYTMAENANEWSIMDGDDQLYHAGHFYENLHKNHLEGMVRSEWKDYGELFEVDSLKDSGEDDTSSLEDVYAEYAENKPLLYPTENLPRNYVEDVSQSISQIEESNESESKIEKLQAQDTQIREVKVLPNREFMERSKKMNQTRINNSFMQDNTITRTSTTMTPPVTQKKVRKPPTPTPELISLTTTTSTTPFPLYTPQRPKRRRPRPQDDIPEYMRFKRDISHIQKIPPKHLSAKLNQNNIQKVTPKNPKIIDNEVRRVHRDKRETDDVADMTNEDENFADEIGTESTMVTEYETVYTTPMPSENENYVDNVSYSTSENDEEYPEPAEEHFKYVIGKSYDPTKLRPLNEKRSNNFQKFLKTRLARQRKRYEKKNVPIKTKVAAQNGIGMTPTDTEYTTIVDEGSTTPVIPMQTTEDSNRLNEQDVVNIDPNTDNRHKVAFGNLRKRRQFTPLAGRLHVRNFLRNKAKRSKRSIQDTNELLARENEIFDNSKEEFNKDGLVYKIKTQQGKKIMVFDTAKAAQEFENTYNVPEVVEEVFVINLLTTELPPTLQDDLIESKWSDSDDSSSSGNIDTEELYSLNGDSSSGTMEEKDLDSWDVSDNDDNQKKIIIVTGHPRQGFTLGGNQLVGNFLKTISSVIERVHKRLSGYFTSL